MMIVVVMIMLWCDGDEWCIVFNDSNDDYDGGDCDSVGDVMIKLIMVMTLIQW